MRTKKYSLAYWVKQHTRFVSQPETVLLDAIKVYVEHHANGWHPEIEYHDTPLEFANTLYLEWRKKFGAYPGLFPTPLDVARRAARLLNLQPGQTVLDCGSGFGNLSSAVRECGATAIGVEVQLWAQQVNEVLGLGATRADFLDGYAPPPFDAVITNPPYGKIYGRTDAALDFMLRIADLSRPGTSVAAILPAGFFAENKRPKRAYAELRERYQVLTEEPLPATTFKPLTNIATTLYLFQVADGGGATPHATQPQATVVDLAPQAEPAIPTLLARIDQAQADGRAALAQLHTPSSNTTPFQKQLTGQAAVEFLQSIPTFGVTWPTLPDGRPRAGLPEGLRERMKGNMVHAFRFRWLNEHPAFVTDSDLRVVGEKLNNGQWKWTAQDGAIKITRHDKGEQIEFVEDATALKALAALREHLNAWEVNTPLIIQPRDAWTTDEIALLIAELDRQPILVDDPSLGILTGHDLAAHAEHMGYGLFKLETDAYTIQFDGGGGLRCFPGGHGWSPVEVKRGTFPYDVDGVRKTLQTWLTELGAQPMPNDCAACSAIETTHSTQPPTPSHVNSVESRQLLAQAEKLYSGALLATGTKVKGLIDYGGKQWVSTGGCFSQWADLQRVVPRQDWTGEVFVHRMLCKKTKPHDTYTPATFYTGRLIQHRGQEWVMTDEVLTVTAQAASSAENSAEVQTHVETPAAQATPAPKKSKPLPDGIPEMIEVDMGGRTAHWESAQVVSVVSGKLVCQLAGGQRLKTPANGQDITWRVPQAA